MLIWISLLDMKDMPFPLFTFCCFLSLLSLCHSLALLFFSFFLPFLFFFFSSDFLTWVPDSLHQHPLRDNNDSK